jgi:hypothetical protein
MSMGMAVRYLLILAFLGLLLFGLAPIEASKAAGRASRFINYSQMVNVFVNPANVPVPPGTVRPCRRIDHCVGGED